MTLPTRVGVLGLAAALSATTLSMLPTAAQAVGVDPTPPARASAWLTGQLQGGLLRTGVAADSAPDVEASMDAALGFQALGDNATAASITTALEPEVAAYIGAEPATRATQLARTAWFAQTLRAGNATYGGTAPEFDLAARVAAQVDDGTGRLADDTAGTTDTVVGQVYATSVLARAADAEVNNALTYLTALQCGPGYFVANLPAVAATPLCDATQQPSVAATATAIIALRDVPAAQVVRTKAITWLAAAQQTNGRWTDNGAGGPGDAATTGLAGQAMSIAGRNDKVESAAIWLRGQQLANAGSCVSYPAADVGAVALDSANFDSAPTTAITATDARVQSFRRATARALPVLKASPGGSLGAFTQVSVPRFSKPGKPVVATVRAAARNVVCATAPTLTPTRLVVAYDGTVTYPFTAGPSGVTTTTVVDSFGQSSAAGVTSLPKKKLGLKFRSKRVRFAKTAVVKVTGLAPGETVRVQFRGKRKATAVANGAGKAKLRFIATGARGLTKVRVAGEYPNRNRTKFLNVVRR